MNSSEIKTKVLHYWRFRRRFKFISTEVGPYNSDVLVSNGKEVIECEIKVSKNDIRQEFNKQKHILYFNSQNSRQNRYIPNKFYFAVPESLVKHVISVMGESPYGIISVDHRPLSKRRKECFCRIARQANPITLNFSKILYNCIIMRMGSELIRHRLNDDHERIRRILKKFRKIRQLQGH